MCNSYSNLVTVDSARAYETGKLRLDGDVSYGHDSFARVSVGTEHRSTAIELNRESAALLRDTLTSMLAAQDVTQAAYNDEQGPQPLPQDSLNYVLESGNEVLVSKVTLAANYAKEYAAYPA